MRLVQRHAGGGGGERAATIKSGGVEDRVARLRARLEDRVAMLDVGQRRHAVEQCALVRVGDGIAAEFDEFSVDVMRRRDRGADPVEPGLLSRVCPHRLRAGRRLTYQGGRFSPVPGRSQVQRHRLVIPPFRA